VLREHALDAGPIQLEPDEATRRTAGLLLGEQRRAPVEVAGLAEVDEPAETDLERRVRLLVADRVPRARVLRLDQDQAGLDPADVERADPGGEDPERRAGLEIASQTSRAPSAGIQSS
jgi:hypothetical protein